MKIAVLEPLEERVEEASKRRRVDITTTPQWNRLFTLARTRSRTAGLLPADRSVCAGDPIGEHRSIQRPVGARRRDRRRPWNRCPHVRHPHADHPAAEHPGHFDRYDDGETSTRDIPLDVPAEQTMTPAAVVDAVQEGVNGARAGSNGSVGKLGSDTRMRTQAGRKSFSRCPAARAVVELAGEDDHHSSFPLRWRDPQNCPEHSPTVLRSQQRPRGALPSTQSPGRGFSQIRQLGTPVDAKAATYRYPENVRQTLIAKWQACTIPGCTRRAGDHGDRPCRAVRP